MTASVSVAPTVAQNLFTISMSFDCLLSLAPFGASLHLHAILLQLADLVLNLNLPWPLFGRYLQKEPIFSRTAVIF